MKTPEEKAREILGDCTHDCNESGVFADCRFHDCGPALIKALTLPEVTEETAHDKSRVKALLKIIDLESRLAKQDEVIAVMKKALINVLHQPFNGSWDAQAIFVQETLAKAEEILIHIKGAPTNQVEHGTYDGGIKVIWNNGKWEMLK